MANRIGNSVSLMRASLNVLKLDKELLLLPVMSGIASMLVMASFIVPVVWSGAWQVFDGTGGSYLEMSIVFALYVLLYTVTFYFNAALVGAALIRLDGGDPTVSDGLSIAAKRMGTILQYAVIAATVGMILKMISDRGGLFAKIAAMVGGVAWTMATYLAVPVLVTKDIGAIDAIKESSQIFKRTWGENLAGNYGLGWAMFLLFVLWTGGTIGLTVLAGSVAPVAVLPILAVGGAGYLFLMVLASALHGVYTAALYRFAMTGEAGVFESDVVTNAFRVK